MTNDLIFKFLRLVWSKQITPVRADYGFLSIKDWENDHWSDHGVLLPWNRDKLNGFTTDDLYFTPCVFGSSRRRRETALPSRWLYADLDEVDPRRVQPRPTIAWRTSPGRYQCMWLLDESLPRDEFEKLNQALTYHVGADKGGWSCTKVLRVPGSTNNKYEEPHLVKLLWVSKLKHSVAKLSALESSTDSAQSSSFPRGRLSTPSSVRRKHARRIPLEIRKLLDTKSILKDEDRSGVLWHMEQELLRAGLKPEEVYVLVQATVWNKYRGQRRERDALWREIDRAARGLLQERVGLPLGDNPVEEESDEEDADSSNATPKRSTGLPLVRLSRFLLDHHEPPQWLVEGIWSEAAHGLLGGEEKTYKSVLSMDLGVSVASGTRFLNRFNVPRTGPVFIIQEENDPGDVRDRLWRIAQSRGLGPSFDASTDTLNLSGTDAPLFLLNRWGMELNNREHLHMLERSIRQHRPALVVLDPLYMMSPGVDESDPVALTPILRHLLKLKQKYNVGIQLVHHFHKAQQGDRRRKTQRFSGSGVLGRWWSSAVYMESVDEEEGIVRLSAEHRSHDRSRPYLLTFSMPPDEPDTYEVTVNVELRRTTQRAATDDTTTRVLGTASATKRKIPSPTAYLKEQCISRILLSRLADELEIDYDAARNKCKREGLKLVRRRVRGGVFKVFVVKED